MAQPGDQAYAVNTEECYRALIDAIGKGFCVIEVIFDSAGHAIDYRFLEVNRAFETQTGLFNAAGRRIRELAPAEEEHWFETYGRVARTGQSIHFLKEAARLGRSFSVTAFRIGDPAVNTVGVIFEDITTGLQAEAAVRDRDERLRLIFESAHEYAMFAMDRERRVTAWNTGAQRLLGYQESEMLGVSADVIFTEEDRAKKAPDKEMGMALSQGRAGNERWHLRKNGTRFWGSGILFPLHDGKNGPVGFFKVMRDRTLEREIEFARQDTEERMRVAVEAAELGVWTYDPIAGVVTADERVRAIFAIPPDAPVSYTAFIAALHPEDRDRVHQHVERTLRGDNPDSYKDEYRVVGISDGAVRWIRAAGRVYFNEQRIATRFVGTMQDISEMVHAREVLARERDLLEQVVTERTAQLRDTVQQLETFSYSVVHDMRAPLRSMRSFAHLLLEGYSDALDEAGRGYLDRIIGSAERMDALITDVLSYSRVSSAEAAAVRIDLDQLVREIMAQYPQFQDAAANIDLRSPLPSVCGNRALLTQCIFNLVGNALKFVPPGRTPQVVIRAETLGKTVRLWIEDNGIGIAPEFHERIFALFQRLHRIDQYPGTGVGLAIVRKAVERMGGRIGLESQVGQGTRFWIELPSAT